MEVPKVYKPSLPTIPEHPLEMTLHILEVARKALKGENHERR